MATQEVVVTGERSREERDRELRKRAIKVEDDVEASTPTAKQQKLEPIALHDCVWLLNGDAGEEWSGRIVFGSDRRLKAAVISGHGEIGGCLDMYTLSLAPSCVNMAPTETHSVCGTKALVYETEHVVGGTHGQEVRLGMLTIELSDGLPADVSEDGCGSQQKRLSGHFEVQERECDFDAPFSMYRAPGRC